MKKDFDLMAKLAVIGDSSVGKTNLLLRYVNSQYNKSHIATIGIDFKVKTIDINGYKIKMQIWDTAGQQRFRNLTGTIYQGAHAVVLAYAINDRQSFENLQKWIQDIKNFAKNDVIVSLVGNKCDLEEERAVSKEEGAKLASSIGAFFYQTSAKEDINVEKAFESIAQKLHKNLMSSQTNTQPGKVKDKRQRSSDSKDSGIKQDAVGKDKVVLDSASFKESNRKKCC